MSTDPATLVKLGAGLISAVKSLLTVKDSYDKQHVDLLKTKVQMLLDLAESYKNENEELKSEIEALKEKNSHYVRAEEFVEHRGAAFKKNADGSFNKTPFCPKCHGSLSAPGMHIPYKCSNKECGHLADFKKSALSSVLSEL